MATPTPSPLLLPTSREQDTATGVDLFMLMCFGGGDRTINELAALATDSGLRLSSQHRVSDGRIALELALAASCV